MTGRFRIFFLLLPLSLQAEVPLSLREAMDIALKNNYDLQIIRNTAEEARLANTSGMAGALPTVGISVRDKASVLDVDQEFSTGTTINREGTTSNTLGGDATVSYTLFNGFSIRATKARLEALHKIGEQELLLQLQNTLAEVIFRYFDVVRQQGYKSALERGRDFADQKLKILEQRQKVGMSNNADVFQARIDLNVSDQHLAEQSLLIRKANVDLAVQLGMDADTVFLMTDSMTIGAEIPLDSVLSKLDAYPEMLAAAARVTVSEQYIREARSQRLPSLRMEGGYSYGRTRNSAGFSLLNLYSGPSAGATLAVPIFNGGSYRTQEKIAGLQYKSAVIEEQMVRQRLEAQVIKAYEAYRTAVGQLEQQEESHILSNQLLDIQLLRFSNGQSTILDLRAAQSAYEEAAAGLENARFVAVVAETELRRLMSVLK
ncbi:MAG: hypothetical protein RL213_1006 [Bacteroidota bacterium]|jgi:outer membrane protein TolC